MWPSAQVAPGRLRVKDAFVRLRRVDGRKPPLPVVVASLIVSIGIWVVICHAAGRIVWTW
ncbi:hypothetical protein SAMN05192568_10924 [Methylobacterium pseudosasicola]|uniref:Uncharacterized protein n=1 Tax=Methylobacterium pseudosasicola TaxID=582667 RepID=A0A1I4VAV7_9HYPH|nr:hypothetical protein SAMN05192568_10924 [Methylobacterium pseudosasicola]